MNTSHTKPLAFLILLFVFTRTAAQTASSICMEELRAAFAKVDQRKLVQDDKVFLAEYFFTSQLQEFVDMAPRTEEQSFLITNGRMQFTSPETAIYSSASDAWLCRPQQFVIYHVKPQLDQMWLLHKVDPGILDFAIVEECHFVRPNLKDSTSKEFRIVINEEGQKKYRVSSLLVYTNPVGNQLKEVKIVYLEGEKYSFVKYTFRHIHEDAYPSGDLPEMKSFLLDESGKLLQGYSGFQVIEAR